MSVTIAPIRLVLVILLLLLAWPFAAIAVAFRSEEDKLKPMSGWRLLMNWPLVYIGQAIIVAGGFRVWPVKGERATASQAPVLVAAPHSGIFDIILYFLVLPMSSPVSRQENGNIPIFGSMLKTH